MGLVQSVEISTMDLTEPKNSQALQNHSDVINGGMYAVILNQQKL